MLRRAALLASSLLLASSALPGCIGSPEDAEVPENVNPSHDDAITMAPCGTVLGTFDGTSAYSNGNDTATGYSCDGAGAYGLQYQCVELVMRHFKTHWGLRWYGNAKDLLANAPGASVDVRWNGDAAHPPVPGDMIVWTNGAYGHVALVTAVHASSIDILEQNVKGNGKATLSWDGATIGARWGNWVPAGWAHAKANGNPPDDGSSGGSGGSGGGTGTGGSGGAGGGNNGVDWNCSDSSYNGNQYWTCSNGSIYHCSGGVPEMQDCQYGCQVNPIGTDDTCKPAPQPQVDWDCNKSSYNGNQYWTCSNGSIYHCSGGVPEKQDCQYGCQVNPVGTDDVCKSAPQQVNWNCANSSYNGNQYWTCSNGDIYRCSNGVPEMQDCANGCKSNPLGTNDVCL